MKIEKREKKLFDCLKFTISKDETRPFLNGVCHVEKIKSLCSTDGHCATILKSQYDDNLADKVICNNTFKTIERDYPNISGIIPNYKKLDMIEIKIKKHFYVKSKLPTHIYLEENKLSFEKNDNSLMCFNANYLKPLADDTTYNFYYNPKNENAPILIQIAKSFEYDFFMMMPIASKYWKGANK